MISDINFIPTWLLSLPCQIGLDLDLPQLLREFVNEHWKTVIMYLSHFLRLFELKFQKYFFPNIILTLFRKRKFTIKHR